MQGIFANLAYFVAASQLKSLWVSFKFPIQASREFLRGARVGAGNFNPDSKEFSSGVPVSPRCIQAQGRPSLCLSFASFRTGQLIGALA
jgi:hypothetical protein